ncbi:hypothetical protein NIES4106_49230 [Fischerella sp. NIES-4106]|jgi:hypothetical protein|nr:hypothetical protein NIES4106_49230 [Fischerella sp. NIES-4106]
MDECSKSDQEFLVHPYKLPKGQVAGEFEELTPDFLIYHRCANCSITYMGTHILLIKARFFIWQFKAYLVHLHREKFSLPKVSDLQVILKQDSIADRMWKKIEHKLVSETVDKFWLLVSVV